VNYTLAMPSLRPHDIAVALQLVLKPGLAYGPLADAVGLSRGEVHNVVKRLTAARLIQADQRKPNVNALLEFLQSGVQYAFPAVLGPPASGVPTAHSAPPLANDIVDAESVVWPSLEGHARGASVEPLYRAAPRLAKRNRELYELLALVDALRIGQARERQRAKEILRDRISTSHGRGHE
jgi:DNA-binding Lrp family transcriptional regulator